MRGAILWALFGLATASRLSQTGSVQQVVDLLKEALVQQQEAKKHNEEKFAVFTCDFNTQFKNQEETLADAVAAIEEGQATCATARGVYADASAAQNGAIANIANLKDEFKAEKDRHSKEKKDLNDSIEDLSKQIEKLENAVEAMTTANADRSVFLAKEESLQRAAVVLEQAGMQSHQISLLQGKVAPTFKSKAGGVFGILDGMKDTMENEKETAQDKLEKSIAAFTEFSTGNSEQNSLEEAAKESAETRMEESARKQAQCMQQISDETDTADDANKLLAELEKRRKHENHRFNEAQGNSMNTIAGLEGAIRVLDTDSVFNSAQANPVNFLQIMSQSIIDEFIAINRAAGPMKAAAMLQSQGHPFKVVFQVMNDAIKELKAQNQEETRRFNELTEERKAQSTARDTAIDNQNQAQNAFEAAEADLEEAQGHKEGAQRELGALAQSMKDEKDQRAQENAQFLEDASNMDNVIKALKKAVNIIYAISNLDGEWTESAKGSVPEKATFEQSGTTIRITTAGRKDGFNAKLTVKNGKTHVVGDAIDLVLSSDGMTMEGNGYMFSRAAPTAPEAGEGQAKGDYKVDNGKVDGATAAIQELIKDYERDLQNAKSEEEDAAKTYATALGLDENQTQDLKTSIKNFKADIKTAKNNIEDSKENRASQRAIVKATKASLLSTKQEFKFFDDKLDQRVKERKDMIKAIKKAKDQIRDSPAYKNAQKL